MLERSAGIALWRQIERTLASEVEEGALEPGARLPTEHELSSRFDVNRHTVRRAIAALVERGLVRVEQGRGTFVQEHVLDYLVGKRTRFSENVARQNRSPGGQLLAARELPADAVVAKALEIERGAAVALLETIGEVDGRPVSMANHYFPSARFPGMIEVYKTLGSITRTLTEFDCGDYTRKVTRVMARMPDAGEADHLKQPRNRPVLVTEAVNVDRHGMPVEYGVTRYAADRFQIVFET